ncbi:MAG TPA: hypothetical protein VER03_25035 [Bryobacteraceae bacterium]|nr:hypothetical protein [Bryobacteraceae bacterium]
MNGEAQLVTVYRSADQDANRDAAKVHEYLAAHEVNAVIFNDSMPGVVQGSCEVRVAEHDVPQSEALLANYDPDAPQLADPSRELDAVPIASMMGATGEIEAIGVKSVLDAAGIPNVLVGDSTLPNLEFHIRVARADVERAQAVLAEAQAAGPAAAAEAQQQDAEATTDGPPA